ncbi:L-gulonolactone oxidase-like, partial [Empidonax traillii]|uniref:L-gulonolactone oxidase-like n=1 Tax=Empidonax traillii TaxID=164674 RepID=UPI000FFD848C
VFRQVLDQLDLHLRSSQYFRFLWFPHSDHVRIIYQDPTDPQAPSSPPSSWLWDRAVGHHLLEFLLWIRPGLGCFPLSGNTREALMDLQAALDAHPGLGAHFPVEVRFSKGDEVWLSPCFQRDSCFINVVLYRPYGKDVPRREYWRIYEGIMRKHGGRPHWAKAHSCTRPELEKMFPAFPKFCSVRERLDPTGIFLNPYLERVFC